MAIQSKEYARNGAAIADRAVWEKITKGRAGIRWDNVVEKLWNCLGDREEVLSIERSGLYKNEVKARKQKGNG